MTARPPMAVWISTFLLVMFGLTIWQIIGTPYLQIQFQEPARVYMHVPKTREETKISYTADSLPSWDYTRLINFTDFKFLLTNTVCDEKPLDLLLLVVSAPKNLKRRNTIRETWGQKRNNVKVLFLLGGVDDQEDQNNFDNENGKYHDLVQGNFKDSYKNLTYKHQMSFKYTVYYCPSAKYLLKVDDDLFVNVQTILDYLKLLGEKKNDLLLCNIMDGSPAIREKSKWHVSFQEYPHNAYPVYCSGFAVIYSYDVVFRLYREAQRGDYFWVEDAHMTGTIANRINIKHTSIPTNVMMSGDEMTKFIESNGTEGPDLFFYGPVNIGAETIRKLWTALDNRHHIIDSTIQKQKQLHTNSANPIQN